MTDSAVATTPADADPPVYNPFDPAFRADPYPFYDRLRTTCTGARHPDGSDDHHPLRRRLPHVAQQRLQPRRRRQRHATRRPDLPAPTGAPQQRREDDPQPRSARSHPPAPAREQGVHAVGDRGAAGSHRAAGRCGPRRRRRTRLDGARRRAGLPGPVPGDLRPARPPAGPHRRDPRVEPADHRVARADVDARDARRQRPGRRAAAAVPDGGRRGPAQEPRQRRAVGAAGGRGGGRPSEHRGAAGVRRAAVRRRSRDHGQPDRQRHARPAQAPRRAGTVAKRSVARRGGSRRVAALRRTGAAHRSGRR